MRKHRHIALVVSLAAIEWPHAKVRGFALYRTAVIWLCWGSGIYRIEVIRRVFLYVHAAVCGIAMRSLAASLHHKERQHG
jgi:hypothetical protein